MTKDNPPVKTEQVLGHSAYETREQILARIDDLSIVIAFAHRYQRDGKPSGIYDIARAELEELRIKADRLKGLGTS